MEELSKFIAKGLQKTIDDLCRVVEHYMKYEVDGDCFSDEQHFENAVRAVLAQASFDVREKQDVKNAVESINERCFGDINRQIPDIEIHCADGLVFLELKFKRSPNVYQEDEEKCANYLKQGKCNAAGVLFLDDTERLNWKQCLKNTKYYYLWKLQKKTL